MTKRETVINIRAKNFEPWKLLGDYALVDAWIEKYPHGFDITVERQGTYSFRPSSTPLDPSITSLGIYVTEFNVYYVTNSRHGVRRKPRAKKGQPDLGTGEETFKTLPPASV